MELARADIAGPSIESSLESSVPRRAEVRTRAAAERRVRGTGLLDCPAARPEATVLQKRGPFINKDFYQPAESTIY